MNAIAFANTKGFVGSAAQTTRQKMKTKLQVAGAAMGLIGGVGAGIFGGLLTATSWMSANPAARHWLSSAGSTLLLLTIPLFIFGACCLDWLEKNHA
ncbi:MAG: hypothetical protein AB7P14_09960 [Blastocatellales bacterium]